MHASSQAVRRRLDHGVRLISLTLPSLAGVLLLGYCAGRSAEQPQPGQAGAIVQPTTPSVVVQVAAPSVTAAASPATPPPAVTSATPPAAATATGPQDQAMQQALLTLADLPGAPAAWQALDLDPTQVVSPSIRACGQPLFSFPNALFQYVAFINLGDIPFAIIESIFLPERGTAPAEFERLATLFRNCTAFVDLDRPQDTISVAPLPFPQLGDQSAAFSFETTDGGELIGINSDGLVRYGDYLVVLGRVDLLSVDQAAFELIARTAAQKLSVLPR